MRAGIAIQATAEDHRRLRAVIANRNSQQKHVWRAQIVLPTALPLLAPNPRARGARRHERRRSAERPTFRRSAARPAIQAGATSLDTADLSVPRVP